jgi:hypothetical protein
VKPFRVGETVFGVRDMELSDKGTVVGYEESERGFVLVRFADDIPRALPVASLVRAADRKAEPRFASKNLAESTTLGDYLTRIESGISQKEKRNNEETR